MTGSMKVIKQLAVTPDEAAKLLSISRDTFDRHVRDKVRHACIGSRRVIPVVELERYLERHFETGA